MDPSKVEKVSTKSSGIILALIIAALIAVAAVVALNPSVLQNVVITVLFILLALVAIVVIALVFAGVIAIPVYMEKGTTTQTDMSYDLDDVKEVDGAMEKKE